MNRRFVDISNEVEGKAIFLGGTEHADLWLSEANGALICQYETDDDYLSYLPADALLHHARGKIDAAPDYTLRGLDLEGKPICWFGKENPPEKHDPKLVAHYLVCFAPYLFTDGLREQFIKETEND